MKKLISILFFLFPAQAFACMCVPESIETKFLNYPYVIYAKGTGETETSDNASKSKFKVIKVFKGDLKKDQFLLLNTDTLTSCEGPTAGKSNYVMFVYHNEYDQLTANKCGVFEEKEETSSNKKSESKNDNNDIPNLLKKLEG
ncbi:MAG: hypothetical protein OEY19_04640, partial [Gammaproteobacteria bacterium]|nr:hypothetical protein [Gammaproteobacteria bacterium]